MTGYLPYCMNVYCETFSARALPRRKLVATWWRATFSTGTCRLESAPFSEPAWLPGNALFVYYQNLYWTLCLFLRQFCFFVPLNTSRPIFNIHVWIRKPVYVERLYCKRPIQCLESSKILTPHPLPPGLWYGGRTHSLGGEGDGGSIFWKTPDTALYSIFVSTL